MNTYFDNHNFVRLWKDGSTTLLETNGRDKFDSIILHKDRCDALYHNWAASDTGESFYAHVKGIEDADTIRAEILEVHGGPLTPDDFNHIAEQTNT